MLLPGRPRRLARGPRARKLAPLAVRPWRGSGRTEPGPGVDGWDTIFVSNMPASPIFDAHLHIVDPRVPPVRNPGFVPEPFPVDAYRRRVAFLGVAGGAVVSTSFRGFDQVRLVDASGALGPSLPSTGANSCCSCRRCRSGCRCRCRRSAARNSTGSAGCTCSSTDSGCCKRRWCSRHGRWHPGRRSCRRRRCSRGCRSTRPRSPRRTTPTHTRSRSAPPVRTGRSRRRCRIRWCTASRARSGCRTLPWGSRARSAGLAGRRRGSRGCTTARSASRWAPARPVAPTPARRPSGPHR